ITKLIKTSWQENTINWSNQPSVFETPYHTTLAGTTLGVSIPITNFVSSWYNKTYSNYGVMIALSNESNVDLVLSFHSRESSVEGALPPQLAITYSPTAVVVPPPDTVPPTIVIDAPSDAQSSSLITITATASDSSGVKYLILYLTIATTKPPPPEELCKKYATYKVTTLECSYKSTFDPGNYLLYAEAEDQVGNKAKSPSQSFRVAGTTPIVEVSLSPSDTPPYVPGQEVTIKIKATDPDGIIKVKLKWILETPYQKEFPPFEDQEWSYPAQIPVEIDHVLKIPAKGYQIDLRVEATDMYGSMGTAFGTISMPMPPYQWNWGLSDHNYGNPDLNWSQYEDTFGWKEIAWKSLWGCYACFFYEFYYEEAAEPGQCTGFAALSLRLYKRKWKLEKFSKTATRVKHLTKNELHHTLGYLQGMITSEEFIDKFVDVFKFITPYTSPKRVMYKVKDDLEKDKHPALVVWNSSIHEAHTVLVDRVVKANPTEYRIYVYDSNRETISTNHNVDHSVYENYPYVTIDTENDSWRFTMENKPEWSGRSTKDTGFLVYIPEDILLKDDYDIPGGIDLLMWFFEILIGSANARIEDEEGRRLGFGDDMTFHWEIPEAFPLPPIGQETSFVDREIYILPRKTYKTILKGTEDGTYDYGIFWGGRYAYHLEAETTQDTTDKVLYSHSEDIPGSFTFETSDEEKPFSLSIVKVFELFKNERIYKVKTRIFKTSQATLKVSEDFESLVYENNGAEEIEYTVEFQTTFVPEGYDEEMPPTATKTLTIGPYQTHILTPKDWLNLDETEVEVKVLGKKTLSDILKENLIYISLALILLAIFLTFLALRRRPPKKKRPPKIVKLE
ncbi:MAG: DNRLRE domain-containing protein, partial [Candidatus Methanofastidiosia archaeon]